MCESNEAMVAILRHKADVVGDAKYVIASLRAALAAALHNCAEELLAAVEAGEKVVDTPDHGYEKGLFVTRDRFDKLRAALAALREKEGK